MVRPPTPIRLPRSASRAALPAREATRLAARHPRLRAAALLGIALLAGCAGGGGNVAGDDSASHGLDTGYSASDARIVETGPDGRPRYALRAATIQQDPRTLEVGLERLSMEVRDDGAAPWRLTADDGLMPEDASRIDLRGDVRIVGVVGADAAGAGGQALEIRSEALRYEFGATRVTTDAEVTLRLTGKWLEARGLEANLKQRQVRLESNVHGRFVP
ncbi:MAG: LPS export ABC transporter periplasmic protein LptC [Gammaproteobacteria bacterium]|nr:LPS export ABC transporter periplasmic protein LptC [Gammaproteobacteria bacterium]